MRGISIGGAELRLGVRGWLALATACVLGSVVLAVFLLYATLRTDRDWRWSPW